MNRTRWLAATAATVMLVLGGGAALAAAGSSKPASDFLGDVAKRLGISHDRLEAAIEDETIARIDAALAAGDLTKAEGDALKERVRSEGAPFALPSFGGPKIDVGPLGPPPPLMPHGTDPLEAAADYLGMDVAEVREALRDGKSLADLAKEKGKSVDGLKQALVGAIRKNADQAVEDGVLTKEQADRIVEKLRGGVDKLVEGELRGGFGFRGGGDGYEFHFRVEPHRVPLPDAPGSSSPEPIVPLKPS